MKSRLKAALRTITPTWALSLRTRMRISAEHMRDARDYARSTTAPSPPLARHLSENEREHLQSLVYLNGHALEKGLTLPSPRRPFGLSRMGEVRRLLKLAEANGTALDATVALEALAAVEKFNKGGSISDHIAPVADSMPAKLQPETVEAFVTSRHSVRNFDPSLPVPPEIMHQAVRLAGKTPSVCNRRAYKAHYYSDRDQVRQLLELQNGNAGFRETIPGLLVITVRRAAFHGVGERNQRWIDGGLFAMSLVWILHGLGIGSCFLNWAQTHKGTSRLRALGGISESEDVITMIAVGYPAEGYRYTVSPERPIDDIYEIH